MDRHIYDQYTGRSEGNANAAFAGEGRVPDLRAGGGSRQPVKTRRGGWFEHVTPERVVVSRQPVPVWDLRVDATLPPVRSRRRLAHQVRQDLWRALRGLRGFLPAVEVVVCPNESHISAGGTVRTRSVHKAYAEARIADVLNDPDRRARWVRCAGGVYA